MGEEEEDGYERKKRERRSGRIVTNMASFMPFRVILVIE